MAQKIDKLFQLENIKPKYELQVLMDKNDIAETLQFTSATDFHFFVASYFWDRIFDVDLYKVQLVEIETGKIVYDSRKD